MAVVDRQLAALAAAYGVATRYVDGKDEPVSVPPETVRAVLRAMGVPSATRQEVRASLLAAEEAPWRRLIEPTVVVTQGSDVHVPVTAPPGPAQAVVDTERGERRELPGPTVDGPGRDLHGVHLTRRPLRIPPDLEAGTHRLTIRAGKREEQAFLLVTPPRCPAPPPGRLWGWQLQLYALRSAASWGIGDLADLRMVAERSATDHGADLVLLNPLHAAMPVLPQEPSPYYPASRRFANPLYLRVEECDGFAALDRADREEVARLAAAAHELNTRDRIDRDAVFRLKYAAFEHLAARPLPAGAQRDYDAYQADEGQGLVDFATACALAERHGRSYLDWPAPLRDPRSAAVAQARSELAERVELHTWLQWQCDRQLRAAADRAQDAGMSLGLITDLAVGVDPGGADAWALAADLARGVSVGAPPDAFNQLGQDWRLPPLRPDRLGPTGFAPFRDLVRSSLRHAGGLRIDHILGLFRLFWIPEGATAAQGTYVRYPADALLGVLALEAASAGAVVVGEDLGTVEPGVRSALRERGILGSRVLWFEREESDEAAPEPGVSQPRLHSRDYPQHALTSVTTHDLPTAAGFLAGEPARVRHALGQLGHDLDTELDNNARERQELMELLIAEGLLEAASAGDRDAVLLAMHAFVARTPSLLVTASLSDGVGDLRQPNLPGTTDTYPNWRLPVGEPAGSRLDGNLLPPSRPLLLETLLDHPGVARLAHAVSEGRSHAWTS